MHTKFSHNNLSQKYGLSSNVHTCKFHFGLRSVDLIWTRKALRKLLISRHGRLSLQCDSPEGAAWIAYEIAAVKIANFGPFVLDNLER